MKLLRDFTTHHPGVVIEPSMRCNLPSALAALEQDEVDLAFGYTGGLPDRLPAHLAARIVATTPVIALISARGPLAERTRLTRHDLQARTLWWPGGTTSPELAAYGHQLADHLGAGLITDDEPRPGGPDRPDHPRPHTHHAGWRRLADPGGQRSARPADPSGAALPLVGDLARPLIRDLLKHLETGRPPLRPDDPSIWLPTAR